jgi:hypothetical protein
VFVQFQTEAVSSTQQKRITLQRFSLYFLYIYLLYSYLISFSLRFQVWFSSQFGLKGRRISIHYRILFMDIRLPGCLDNKDRLPDFGSAAGFISRGTHTRQNRSVSSAPAEASI